MTIPPRFQRADNFSPAGLARAEGPGGFGLIDSRGEYAVLPSLSDAQSFQTPQGPSLWGKVGDWWGRLSPDGAWLGWPRFHGVAYLGEGLFAVSRKGKLAVMGNDGKLLSGFDFDSVGEFERDPHGRTLSVVAAGGKQGLVDGQGKTLIPPAFDSLKPEFDKGGRQIREQGGLQGVLALGGKWVIEPKYGSILWKESEGRYWVKEGALDDSWRAYSPEGARGDAIPRETIIASFANQPQGLIGCYPDDNDKVFGYCDSKGAIVIKQEYDAVGPFTDVGLARVRKGGRYGYVDPKGQAVVGLSFDDARDFGPDGAAFVSMGGKWGVIDRKGAWVLKASLDSAPRPIPEGLWLATQDGKLGILGPKGAWVVEPGLEGFQGFRKTGLAWAKKDGLWGQIDLKGAWALKPTFEDVGTYTPGGLAPAYLSGSFAVVDERGAVVALAAEECGVPVVKDAKGKVSYPSPSPGAKGCKPPGPS
jgi:hypothetical protein